jgi:hypothetical protein
MFASHEKTIARHDDVQAFVEAKITTNNVDGLGDPTVFAIKC